VCPWNRGVEKRRAGQALPEDATPHVSLVDWLRSDPDELRRRFDRLYVPRNDGRRLRLNALVAAGNVGGDGERDAVAEHRDDPDETTRELAVWALARIEERDA
jgi:epoxyqueuosine reductase QueG